MRDRYRLGVQAWRLRPAAVSDWIRTPHAARGPHPDGYAGGVPNTFDGNSIQAATTMPAAGWRRGSRTNGSRRACVGATSFFNLLLSHTIAGFFADPVYSGNQNMIGWKLIGFPGAQLSYANEI